MSKTLEQIEALARGATPGPWESNEDGVVVDRPGERYRVILSSNIYDTKRARDSAYVAAVSPDVILRLVEIVKAAEKVPTSDEIRLAAGELSAQEMRSVKAILHWRASIIAALREALSKT